MAANWELELELDNEEPGRVTDMSPPELDVDDRRAPGSIPYSSDPLEILRLTLGGRSDWKSVNWPRSKR
jgi:hypothetical protein